MLRGFKQPEFMAFHGAGGGADGVYPIEDLRYICKQTGLEPYELFDFFFGESVSSILVAAMTAPHPDDPEKPLLTIEEYAQIFYDNISDFIPYSPNHYKRQTLAHFQKHLGALTNRALKRMGVSDSIHLDRTPLVDKLSEVFGDITLDETIRGICLTTQKIHSTKQRDGLPDRRRSYRFLNVKPEVLKPGANIGLTYPSVEEARIPLWKAVVAGTAYPTVFPSFTVEETGETHIDAGTLANPAPILARLHNNMRRGRRIVYSYFGTGCTNEAINPEEFDTRDWVEMCSNRFLTADFARVQTIMDSVATIQETYGVDNTHILQRYMGKGAKDVGVEMPVKDVFDARKETMETRIAYAQAFIEKNPQIYNPLIERLVENHHLRTRVDPLTAFCWHARWGQIPQMGQAFKQAVNEISRPAREMGNRLMDKLADPAAGSGLRLYESETPLTTERPGQPSMPQLSPYPEEQNKLAESSDTHPLEPD